MTVVLSFQLLSAVEQQEREWHVYKKMISSESCSLGNSFIVRNSVPTGFSSERLCATICLLTIQLECNCKTKDCSSMYVKEMEKDF